MRYEDRQYKISRDRLRWLLEIEEEYYRTDPQNNPDGEEPFDVEKELAKYEELPSNDKTIVKITYLK